MTLFEECIQALGDSVNIIKQEEAELLFNKLQSNFPFTTFSRIAWDNVHDKVHLKLASEVSKHIDSDSFIYILWDNANCPVIETTLQNALDVIDDVTAVSFDTWFFNPNQNFVIEFHHEGNITIGYS